MVFSVFVRRAFIFPPILMLSLCYERYSLYEAYQQIFCGSYSFQVIRGSKWVITQFVIIIPSPIAVFLFVSYDIFCQRHLNRFGLDLMVSDIIGSKGTTNLVFCSG